MAALSPMDALLLQQREKEIFDAFLRKSASRNHADASEVLRAIPPSTASYGPMASLSALIAGCRTRWPPLDLQQAYTRTWKMLPEEAKSGQASAQSQELLERTLQQCKRSYSSLMDLFHFQSDKTAMIDPETGCSLSHSELASCVRDFGLSLSVASRRPKPVIAISLPNGLLLAVTVLSVATYYTAAPIAHGSGVGSEQFKSDVLQSRATLILASPADVARLGLRDNWIQANGLKVLLIELNSSRLLLRELDGGPVGKDWTGFSPRPNTAEDIAVMLFTSGTSGTKKLVPLSVHSMVSGVAMVIESWGLSSSMRCLNQMPLNHVGGLVRNLFAPIMSGGSIICCSAFDANLFWDCVEDHSPTWYYASPTMHQCILEAGADRSSSVAKSQIRLICNAAGGLLPSLACQLRDTFSRAGKKCVVLPSYGMTECMPISTPPLDYRLEKTGTSGLTVGPEICILNGADEPLPRNSVGRVSVRGAPVFEGYLKPDSTIDATCFTKNGWFDTGDMGYLDAHDYLYITGRSKEVINRGGELISPFEVEEAIVAAAANPHSPTFGKVSKALAFSVTHNVLQEVVGIAVVTPVGSGRVDLRGIQQSVKGVLGQVKLPVVVVHMNGGLPMNNNKILRIKLAERLSLPSFTDATPAAERHYEADCPLPNTPLHVRIRCNAVFPQFEELLSACERILSPEVDFHVRPDTSAFHPELILAPSDGHSIVDKIDVEWLLRLVAEECDGHLVPSAVHQLSTHLPRFHSGLVDNAMVNDLLASEIGHEACCDMSPTETAIAHLFNQVLLVPVGRISSHSDFFELGGDSMAAGRVLTCLRKEFQVRLAIDVLFTNSSISALATIVNNKITESTILSDHTTQQATPEQLLPSLQESHSSTNPLLMALQLVPMGICFPMRRAFTWTLFMYAMSFAQTLEIHNSIPGRLVSLVVAMTIANAVTKTLAPLLAVVFKWLVIGRYQEGVWPMWGSYHTRWWICQKVIAVSGMGVWGWFDTTRILYYRCLGVRIGRGVTIDRGATLGEYDLITLHDGVNLERCTVRPFAAERNTSMYLGRIDVGANSSVGLASTIAPGTSLAPGTCIGPNSSSWEMDGDEANRDLASRRIPEPHWLLCTILGLPLKFICTFIGAIPWLAALVALVNQPPNDVVPDELRRVCLWFASPERVGFHYLALAAHASVGPIFFFMAVLALKKTVDGAFGKVRPTGAATRSQFNKFRMQLLRSLMPAPQLHKVTELFGTHYEATSVLYRALGSKVGKRVYWPGTGPTSQDYDMLEIGDNVVFGSRSHLVTSDGSGSDYVRIEKNAMVADRVILLPGVELGEKSVMGSGALTRRNARYPADTTWVGSTKGEAICLTAPPTSRPRAASHAEKAHAALKASPSIGKNFNSYNSSSTTIAGHIDSEASSISAIEKGRGTAEDPNGSKAGDGAIKRTTSVTVTEKTSEADADSSSPFGRAFYQGQAHYRVWSQFEVSLYSTLIVIATVIFWNIGSISAVQVVARLYVDDHPLAETFLAQTWFRPFSLYCFFLALITGIMALQSAAVLAFLVAAKWILLGRRQPGNYDWDKSPYCQRWQLFLKLESFRRHCYGGNGILGMLTGTHWIVLYFRALGATVGKDCSLFSGGLPSLTFTEPDLLFLGDRVSVDDASLVAHINTRGKFDLNPLHVGDRSVLRSGSRLLSGARMEADTCLMEHTLVMAGEQVEKGCTMQGWPAEEFRGSRMPTLGTRRGMDG